MLLKKKAVEPIPEKAEGDAKPLESIPKEEEKADDKGLLKTEKTGGVDPRSKDIGKKEKKHKKHKKDKKDKKEPLF
jgi:hypothetical protein